VSFIVKEIAKTLNTACSPALREMGDQRDSGAIPRYLSNVSNFNFLGSRTNNTRRPPGSDTLS
jgi:hypothetical protein